MNSSGSGQEQAAGYCEHGNEHAVSTNTSNFFINLLKIDSPPLSYWLMKLCSQTAVCWKLKQCVCVSVSVYVCEWVYGCMGVCMCECECVCMMSVSV